MKSPNGVGYRFTLTMAWKAIQKNVVIPLTHYKNSGYTELKVLSVYLSPAFGGGKIYNAQLSFCLPHF